MITFQKESHGGHFKGPSDAHSCQIMFESDVISTEWPEPCSNAIDHISVPIQWRHLLLFESDDFDLVCIVE